MRRPLEVLHVIVLLAMFMLVWPAMAVAFVARLAYWGLQIGWSIGEGFLIRLTR